MDKKDITHATTTAVLDPELATLVERYQKGQETDCDRKIGTVIIIPRKRLEITQQLLESYTNDLQSARSKNQQLPKDSEKETGPSNNTSDTTCPNMNATASNPENEKAENINQTMHYSVHYLDPQKPEDGILYIVVQPTLKEAAAIAELPWVARLERPKEFHAELKG